MFCWPKTKGATTKQTRNRAGKTSFVELVHFLLGADAGRESIFRTPELLDHSFGMDFYLKSEHAVVERSGSSKAKIFVTAPPAEKVKFSATEWCTFRRTNVWFEQPRNCRQQAAYVSVAVCLLCAPTGERRLYDAGKAGNDAGHWRYADGADVLLGLDWQIARDWQAVRDREKTLEELKRRPERRVRFNHRQGRRLAHGADHSGSSSQEATHRI